MITVFLADDHAIVREGIIALLHREPDIQVVGEASDGAAACEKVLALSPAVVLMDISMPGLNGIQAAQDLFANGFSGKVIVLTQHEQEEYVRLALQVGVSGYLLKYSVLDEVLAAIRSVAGGDSYFSPPIAKMFAGEFLRTVSRKRVERQLDLLTARETEVLQYIAEGKSSKQIADLMFIGLRTVEFHRANIIQKLGIRDVAGLTRFAIKQGLVKP